MEKIIDILLKEPNLNSKEIDKRINATQHMTEGYIQELKEKNIIEFKGTPKTGGYHITEEFNQKLNNTSQ